MNLDLSSLTFLVVEDSAYMRTILRTMLQGFGARRIVEAEDGASGLEAMDRANPDILILDWVMPILDGADMVRMIRNPQNPFAYVPVIMVTAHTERSRILEARKLGIHELLCKPISAKALYQRVASVILQPREFVKTPTYFGPAPRKVRNRQKIWESKPAGQRGPSVDQQEVAA
ncbi:response regulator [Prosthecomicrobium sp. N25]|uniref:response regulator n=1 Tax=Prosthecomicrobium sp. N25 TaxID=3129254 RepID=UPI003076A657